MLGAQVLTWLFEGCLGCRFAQAIPETPVTLAPGAGVMGLCAGLG